VHFLGLAALIGPALIRPRLRDRTTTRIMLTGAAVQVATGNGLIATNRLQDMHVIEAKMVVKLALAVTALAIMVVVAWRGRRGRSGGASADSPVLHSGAAGLGVTAILVAVFWT
jgi:hypothetical protein